MLLTNEFSRKSKKRQVSCWYGVLYVAETLTSIIHLSLLLVWVLCCFQADWKLKALSASFRLKKPDRRFEEVKTYSTELQTHINNILKIRTVSGCSGQLFPPWSVVLIGPWYSVFSDSQWSLILSDLWFSLVPESQWSLILSGPWFSVVSDSRWSLILSGPWFSLVPDSQWSLILSDPWFSLVPDSHWSLILSDHWFSLVPDSHWSLILIGSWFSVVPDSHWSLILSGPWFSVVPDSQWSVMFDWYCIHKNKWLHYSFMVNWITCLSLFFKCLPVLFVSNALRTILTE